MIIELTMPDGSKKRVSTSDIVAVSAVRSVSKLDELNKLGAMVTYMDSSYDVVVGTFEEVCAAVGASNQVYTDIREERVRQDAMHGESNHPDLNPTFTTKLNGASPSEYARDLGIHVASWATFRRMFANDRMSWALILTEGLAKVVDAAARGDRPRMRKRLVQVAAVAVAWIEALDRRSNTLGT